MIPPPPRSTLFPYTTLFRSSFSSTQTISSDFDERLAVVTAFVRPPPMRSEEHTSELQSRGHLVCRLLLEKKKKKSNQAADKSYIHSEQSVEPAIHHIGYAKR